MMDLTCYLQRLTLKDSPDIFVKAKMFLAIWLIISGIVIFIVQ